MKRLGLGVVSLVIVSACAAMGFRAYQAKADATAQLSSFAPEGALLTIESPDFAGLLKSWTGSNEEQRWLEGADYAGFERSRLFSRLKEAQDDYTATAGLPADTHFLQQVAGGQSLLAWYDIGKLEFLYITRMPAGEAEKNPLLSLRGKFEERRIGDSAFYVRVQQKNDVNSYGPEPRTVAFAVHGDYLLLATREDLIANAMGLMDKPGDRTVQNEPWYAKTVAAAAREPGDLRMTLNLSQIVVSPYFRSYWVQQNITQTKQYSAALSDLYRKDAEFREERVMLAVSPENVATEVDLAPVLAYLPAHSGVYRAVAQPETATVLAQLEDKVLARKPAEYRDLRIAPEEDLSVPVTGDALSLEERIDEPPVPVKSKDASLAGLRGLLDGAHVQAMLSYSASEPLKAGDTGTVFLPIHTAVVLSASGAWNQAGLQQSLVAAIAPQISVGSSGLAWKELRQGKTTWTELTGMQGLGLAVQGRVCIVASDKATLLRLLDAAQQAHPPAVVAQTVAGFDHQSEREPFLRLGKLLDRSDKPSQGQDGVTPSFFSGNMASLSDTFQDLDSETFTQNANTDASGTKVVHQTVLYRWHR